jgi:predicted glycogen debranching enzyme
MCTAEKAINDLIEGRPISVKMYEMDQPDVLLWAIWAIQQYSIFKSFDETVVKYGALVDRIVDYIKQGKHSNLFLHENGLLYANGRDKAITWMNSEIMGKPVVPRSGYIVEFNALWYNALVFNAHLLSKAGHEDQAIEYTKLAEVTASSFKDVFLNQHGYLLDYVDDGYISWSVRPNMLIATSLEYSPLTIQERKKVFDICTKELRTPKGIRSLSPKSGGYNPIYEGGQIERDAAYHQGTVWPWLSGFYLETCLKIYKQSGLSFVDRHFVGLEEEMNYHCIGTLPELFDGNPPFHGRGALSFAMNVAEVLRVNKLLSKYDNY